MGGLRGRRRRRQRVRVGAPDRLQLSPPRPGIAVRAPASLGCFCTESPVAGRVLRKR